MPEITRSMKTTVEIEGIELEFYRVPGSKGEVGVSVKSLCTVLGKKPSELPPDLPVVLLSIENLNLPVRTVFVEDFVTVVLGEAFREPRVMKLLSMLLTNGLQQFIKEIDSKAIEPAQTGSSFDEVLEDILVEDAELLRRLA